MKLSNIKQNWFPLSFIGLLILAFLAFSIIRVTDGYIGIKQTFTGEIIDKPVQQGLHLTPFSTVTAVSVRNIIRDIDAQPMVSEKIPMSTFKIKVSYNVLSEKAPYIYKTEKLQHIITEDGDIFLMAKYVDAKSVFQNKNFVPDANATLRFTYGYVKGYSPNDAEYHGPFTSLRGVVEKEDGLWLYTLNMDMMVKMGRKLPSPLKEEANAVRDTIWEMMDAHVEGRPIPFSSSIFTNDALEFPDVGRHHLHVQRRLPKRMSMCQSSCSAFRTVGVIHPGVWVDLCFST